MEEQKIPNIKTIWTLHTHTHSIITDLNKNQTPNSKLQTLVQVRWYCRCCRRRHHRRHQWRRQTKWIQYQCSGCRHSKWAWGWKTVGMGKWSESLMCLCFERYHGCYFFTFRCAHVARRRNFWVAISHNQTYLYPTLIVAMISRVKLLKSTR